jgi:hypothetical protein
MEIDLVATTFAHNDDRIGTSSSHASAPSVLTTTIETISQSNETSTSGGTSNGYMQSYSCRWLWCRLVFTALDELSAHVVGDHIGPAEPMKRRDVILMRRVEEGAGESLSLGEIMSARRGQSEPLWRTLSFLTSLTTLTNEQCTKFLRLGQVPNRWPPLNLPAFCSPGRARQIGLPISCHLFSSLCYATEPLQLCLQRQVYHRLQSTTLTVDNLKG